MRRRLRTYGLAAEAINVAWPKWWSEEAEGSISARAELRFSLARKLGLDPRLLIEKDEPKFIWKTGAFKNAATQLSDTERETILSFGTSVARVIASATPIQVPAPNLGAQEIRRLLLNGADFPDLPGLLALCWAVGIAVVQLQVFPLKAKRMTALCIQTGNRHVIFLARDTHYPSQASYYVAHELGHIALGHVSPSHPVIDDADPLATQSTRDEEEVAADRYALEVLTGRPDPTVLPTARNYTAASLARSVSAAGPSLQIEPGILALCLGHSTGRWDKVFGALNRIQRSPQPVGAFINNYAVSQLHADALSDENSDFIYAILGIESGASQA